MQLLVLTTNSCRFFLLWFGFVPISFLTDSYTGTGFSLEFDFYTTFLLVRNDKFVISCPCVCTS
jgi:hypothetical protein